jgi:hypothetical protein
VFNLQHWKKRDKIKDLSYVKTVIGLEVVRHICNPSYFGGRQRWEDYVLRPAREKLVQDPI